MSIKKRYLAVAGVLALLMICAVSAAMAVASPVVRFTWKVEGQEVSITLHEKKEQTYYLFLPAALQGKDPVVRADQDADIIWGDRTYANGSVLPVESFLDQTVWVTFSNGRRLGNVTIMRGSEIPAMFFTVDADDYKRVNQGTRFDIQKPASMVMLNGDGTVGATEALSSFKTHGNSTFFASKKAFAFKMEHKVALGGMDKNKKWFLLANWFDISLIRNQITYDLFREMGMRGTPDCRQVDLYLNGAYNGTYLLTEKIQLKKGRLEIEDLEETLEELNGKVAYDTAAWKTGGFRRWFDLAQEPEDITGGYLLEIEKSLHYSQMTNVAGFVTDKKMCIVVKEPTHAGKQSIDYIANLVNDFHTAVLRKDGISPATGKYYADYIDMRSFALKVAVDELCANYEVRAGSQFMYKDSDRVDSKLYSGPPWDYDLTYGNKDDGTRNPLKQDYVLTKSSNESYLYHWLLTHEDFQIITRHVFEDDLLPAAQVLLGQRTPAEGSSLRTISEYQNEIRASAAMNFTRWSARAIPDVWDASGRTFEDSGAFVENWIRQRLAMMNESWLLGK